MPKLGSDEKIYLLWGTDLVVITARQGQTPVVELLTRRSLSDTTPTLPHSQSPHS